MQPDIQLIFKGNGFTVVWKQALLHTAPLTPGEDSLLSRYAARFPDVLAVKGRKAVEGGLLHRLDYETRGLVLFAERQEVYDILSGFQEEGLFEKEYRALCLDIRNCPEVKLPPGFPLNTILQIGGAFQIQSAFRPFGPGRRAVRPVSAESIPSSPRRIKDLSFDRGNPYTSEVSGIFPTDIHCGIEINGKLVNIPLVMVRVRISRGFRHQIRAHLAWMGLPLLGDPLYAPPGPCLELVAQDSAPFFLEACSVKFPDPAKPDNTCTVDYESPFRISLPGTAPLG